MRVTVINDASSGAKMNLAKQQCDLLDRARDLEDQAAQIHGRGDPRKRQLIDQAQKLRDQADRIEKQLHSMGSR